ncbi:MAG: Hint domain-containing protein [Roseinatronobacter sp.]
MARLECDLFCADDLRVSWGIHEGDALGPPELCAPGDIYQLVPRARPIAVLLDIGDRLTLHPSDPIADPIGQGGEVTPLGTLQVMAQDGDIVDLIVLRLSTRLFALPLSPLRAAMGYAVIAVEPQDAGLRLTQAVQAAFVAGTRVTLADGQLCPIEKITPGALVLTRDAGAQPVRWVGHVTLRAHGRFAPVTFAPGTLGNLGPLSVNPLQRIFLYQRGDRALGDRAEVLIQAQFLSDGQRVTHREGGFVTYHALAFDDHQILYAEGVPVESLLVSRATIARLPQTLAADLKTRFPQLDQRAHFAVDVPRDKLAQKSASPRV